MRTRFGAGRSCRHPLSLAVDVVSRHVSDLPDRVQRRFQRSVKGVALRGPLHRLQHSPRPAWAMEANPDQCQVVHVGDRSGEVPLFDAAEFMSGDVRCVCHEALRGCS